MLDQIEAAFSLWGRFKNWRHAKTNPPVETIATRFVRLLESHGVHRNQIPRFVGQGLTLQDVQCDSSLLAKLDEPLLQAVCERFAVRREWLDGAESQIYPVHHFYKHPDWFSGFIDKLTADNPDGELGGVLIAPKEHHRDALALLILLETIGFVGDKPIYRYHLCDAWTFNYWKARAYLTACVAIAWKTQVYVHGLYMLAKDIHKLAEGEKLLSCQGEGIWERGLRRRWDPEDMSLLPEAFLKDIDPELDNYGIKAGLQLWLDLEHEGLMNSGFNKDARQLFEQELSKY